MSDSYNYISTLFCPETPQMISAKKRMQEDGWPIHISPIAGQLIQTQLRLIEASKIVEIGPYAGYSTLWMLGSLLQNGGKIWSLERDQKRINLARETFKELPEQQQQQISLISGDAKETLQNISPQGPFDAVFIDADKRFYNEFLDWAEINIRKHGLIIADNVLLEGAVYMNDLPGRVRPSTRYSMQSFNKRLSDQTKYQSFMIDHDDGLLIAQKLF